MNLGISNFVWRSAHTAIPCEQAVLLITNHRGYPQAGAYQATTGYSVAVRQPPWHINASDGMLFRVSHLT
ncbi:MAG TPA: hypothetical protein VE242_07435, partial [Chthoniobacterales bacterium]|nr:hypothetical protein [Chthoniobacterales bacterium]